MKKLIFIKIGGGLLADKKRRFFLNEEVIRIFSKQLKEVISSFPNFSFILGNGAGSFGHLPAVEYKIKGKLRSTSQIFGACFTHKKVVELNQILVENLLQQEIRAFIFTPGSFLFSKKNKIKSSFAVPIFKSLEKKVTPVVFGDVVVDEQFNFSIFSTEKIFEFLIQAAVKEGIGIERVIFLGKFKGVCDSKGRVISEITSKNYCKILEYIEKSEGKDITGGMRHKVESALKLASKGIKVNIVGFSKKENVIVRVLKGEMIGTCVCL